MFLKHIVVSFLVSLFVYDIQAQTCNGAPNFNVNLAGVSDSVWTSPDHSRGGTCCSSNNCTSFDVILDTGAAMINLEILSGAIPSGALYYKINCGPQIAVGSPICVNGQYTFTITFCKPGNNPNVYRITSISKPTLPPNPLTVRLGCANTLATKGFVPGSVTWTSIPQHSNPTGFYNYLLSSTTSTAPVYTSVVGLPATIDYRVCGTPLNSICPGASGSFCDTFRIINVGALTAAVTPSVSAGFCAGGSVVVTAAASGGAPPYTYIWKNQNNVQVGTGTTYTASVAGTYQVDVRDAVYNATSCPGPLISVPVQVTSPPTINTGADKTVCTSSPAAILTATVTNSAGIVWSGGLGTFSPSSTSNPVSYTPHATEIAAGFVNITGAAIALGGGCSNAASVVKIVYPVLLANPISSYSLACNASTTVIATAVSGGISPYSYSWNTGATTSTISAGQGNYCLIVTDAMGCSANSCSNISVPTVLTTSASSTDVTTVAPADEGTASAFPAGGTAPYTYLWTGGQTTSTATGLTAGGYTVIITDANGCTVRSNVAVNSVSCADLAVVITPVDVLCNGGTTGGAVAIPSGGGGAPYTYSWNTTPVKTTSIVVGLSAGPYQVLITSMNGCTRIDNVTLTEPVVLTNSMSHTDVSLVGGNNGTATATPSGGTGPYTYSWSPTGGTNSIATGLVAGEYTVTVTDVNSCSLTDNVQVEEPSCVLLSLNVNSTNVSCFSGSNGTASADLLFGTAPYSYVWSVGGQTTSSISSLSQGAISVVVTDAVNCVLSSTVTITEPTALTLTLTATDVVCNGADDGTLNLTVAGGTFPYSYSWSNGVTVEDQGSLAPSPYLVNVTDAQGCTKSANATIDEPDAITAVYSYQNVTCKNGSDGSANATVSGGILPYRYLWTGGATTEDVTGLSTGQYYLSVTDDNGCNNPAALNIFINEPDSVDLSGYTITCPVPGSGVSKVDVVPIGGEGGPYTVSFDNGSTYLTAGDYSEFLPVGATYSVFVKDGNNCISSKQTIIVNPEPVISNISFPFCNPVGIGTATVTITPGGGAGIPYLISTDNGVSYDLKGDYLDTLQIGYTYTVIIQDTLGCLSLPSAIVIPDSISLDTSMSVYVGGYNISCNGLSNGSIDLTATGGTSPYTFLWDNGATTFSAEDLTNIPAGDYSLTITDAHSCSKSMVVAITEPALLAATSSVTTNYNGSSVSCKNSTNGGVDLSVIGGTTSYTYTWSNTQTTEDMTGLGAGVYVITVKDANNCQATSTVTLTEPMLLTTTVTPVVYNGGYNISCNGLSDGSIDLTVAGGTTAYTYQWSGSSSATTEDITGLTMGTYTVLTTDINGCSSTSTVTLTEPTLLTNTVVPITYNGGYHISCKGLANGSINLTPAGGTTPYTYQWSGASAATTQDVTGLSAGVYNIQITDDNGCTSTSAITLTEPALLANTIAISSNYNGQNVSCFGFNNGSIDLTVAGGTTAYTYSWSNALATQDISGITAGTYSVLVTDNNGCTATNSVTLTQPVLLTNTIAISSNYSGQNISCNGLSDGSIDLTVAGGTTAYTYAWSNSQSTEDISGLNANVYSVIITDVNGCVTTNTITITQPALLTNTIAISSNYNGQNISCNGLSNGSVDLTVAGGTTAYTYSWSNTQTTQDISGLNANTYSVLVTDVNGCTTTNTITITQPLILASSVVPATFNGQNISCFGLSNGSMDMTVSGGTTGYTYSWSNAQTTQDVSGLVAGTYSVLVTDVNGCTSTNTITLTQPAALTTTIAANSNYNGQNISCNGLSDGGIDLSVAGGTTAYTYSWSNSSTTQDVSGLSAGNYTITTTDVNGCSATNTITLTQSAALALTSTVTPVTCNGYSNGAIDVTQTGGTAGFTYSWSNGSTTQSISGIAAGNYTVTVTDVNGCSFTKTDIVSQDQLLVLAFQIANPKCYNATNGEIISSLSGGVSPYQYSWSNGATTQDITGIDAGTYAISVTDSNNCITQDTIVVTQPDSILATYAEYLYFNGFNISLFGSSDGSVDLTVIGGTAPYNFLWSSQDTSEDLSFVPAGNYFVQVTDSNGCVVILTMTLTEPFELEMPTGVSPNGDGSNDIFVVHGLESYPDNEIIVYNRWGNVVFNQDDYMNTWRGTGKNGEDLPEGTYFVVLKIFGKDEITLTGYVDLRR